VESRKGSERGYGGETYGAADKKRLLGPETGEDWTTEADASQRTERVSEDDLASKGDVLSVRDETRIVSARTVVAGRTVLSKDDADTTKSGDSV
jgi:hypothetical protein